MSVEVVLDGDTVVLDSDAEETATDYKKELLRLRSGSLLSDYGIGSYLALQAKEANKKFGTKVEVLSSQYASKSHADATKYWKARKDVVGADIVLWYLDPGGNHWTLMTLKLLSGQTDDPKEDSDEEEKEALIEHFITLDYLGAG